MISFSPPLERNGSPPRRWGIRRNEPWAVKMFGFTPTQVGNTPHSPPRELWNSVHPHAGGEYMTELAAELGVSGSPPRRWGILSRLWLYLQRRRFTPTQVGNTLSPKPRKPRKPVHPHAGGEYVIRNPVENVVGGSPPRRWGIRGLVSGSDLSARFTPTQVGNTS